MSEPFEHALLDVFFCNAKWEECHYSALIMRGVDEHVMESIFKQKVAIIPVHEGAQDALL
jgi:hypothetical protein